MVDVTSQMSVQTAATAKPSARRYYVLGLLTIIYALNFLDRTIFNVLIEPIKKEFQLSDTMMGLLAGFGFALFYSCSASPSRASPTGSTGATSSPPPSRSGAR